MEESPPAAVTLSVWTVLGLLILVALAWFAWRAWRAYATPPNKTNQQQTPDSTWRV